jgi:PAS domain-containing protein
MRNGDPSDRNQDPPGDGGPGGGHAPGFDSGSSREGDRWLRAALENSPEIVKVVDPDGTLRYASPAFGRALGYDPGEAVGRMNVFDHVHPDDLPASWGKRRKSVGGGGCHE